MFRGCLAGADAATKQKFNMLHAVVAELADAPDLGSGVFDVGVQVPSAAPETDKPELVGFLGCSHLAYNKIPPKGYFHETSKTNLAHMVLGNVTHSHNRRGKYTRHRTLRYL